MAFIRIAYRKLVRGYLQEQERPTTVRRGGHLCHEVLNDHAVDMAMATPRFLAADPQGNGKVCHHPRVGLRLRVMAEPCLVHVWTR